MTIFSPPSGLTCLVPLVVMALVAMPSPVKAGHYDLSSIDIVEEATVATMTVLKIATTQDLWEATRDNGRIKALARKVNLSADHLRGLHDLCDLLWVDGIGPKVARVLTAAGVKNLAALARQESVPLAELIRDTNKTIEILGKLPDPDTTRSWIEQARARLKAVVRPVVPSRR